MVMVSPEELKRVLSYNHETGVFTRKINRGKHKAGDIAGTVMSRGYIRIGVNGRTYLAHRLAWLYVYGVWPNEIDHVNHIKDDNRISNLRSVTHQENSRNQSKQNKKEGKNDVTGVLWCRQNKKWSVRIGVNNKRVYVGIFKDKFEAICARKSAENKYNFHSNHGEVNHG
jgi:hypothetical protein